MNINLLKVGKVVSIALPIIGSIVGAVVTGEERKQETIKTTEKLFNEYIENK